MAMPTSTAEPADLAERHRSGFFADYLRSLKSLDVEEPVDLYVHRPLAYLLTRLLYPTRVTPNTVTVMSIASGLVAGVSLVWPYAWHLQVAGLAILLSAVLDCADGQLARLRGTSSAFGRMLDGVADMAVSVCAVGGGIYWLAYKYHRTPWLAALLVLLGVATAVTGSFHTATYDHFKNVFLRLTVPGSSDGEDLEMARRRRAAQRGSDSLGARLAWPFYLFYVSSQEKVVRGFDPYTFWSIGETPKYDSARAAIYRRHATGAMRVWKSCFGFGSMVFGVAVAIAFNVLEHYVVARLLLQNLLFYGYLRPVQRRASRAAFEEMEIAPAGREQPRAA